MPNISVLCVLLMLIQGGRETALEKDWRPENCWVRDIKWEVVIKETWC